MSYLSHWSENIWIMNNMSGNFRNVCVDDKEMIEAYCSLSEMTQKEIKKLCQPDICIKSNYAIKLESSHNINGILFPTKELKETFLKIVRKENYRQKIGRLYEQCKFFSIKHNDHICRHFCTDCTSEDIESTFNNLTELLEEKRLQLRKERLDDIFNDLLVRNSYEEEGVIYMEFAFAIIGERYESFQQLYNLVIQGKIEVSDGKMYQLREILDYRGFYPMCMQTLCLLKEKEIQELCNLLEIKNDSKWLQSLISTVLDKQNQTEKRTKLTRYVEGKYPQTKYGARQRFW